MQTAQLRVSSFLNVAYENVRGYLPATAKTLLDKIMAWLTEMKAGRIAVGLVVFLLSRPLIDRTWRLIHRYPPGSCGIIPLLSTIRDIKSLDHGYLLNQPKIGKVSMHYAGSTPFVLLNSRQAMEEAYDGAGLVHRQPEMAEDKLAAMEDRFRPIIGSTPFPAADGPRAWFARRKMLYSSLIGLLNATILDGMIGGQMESKVFPKFVESSKEDDSKEDDGFIWDDLRQDMTRAIFNTIFRTTFGVEFNPLESELEEFSESVLGFGQIFFAVIVSRKMPALLQKPTINVLSSREQRAYFKKIDTLLRDWLERYKSETAGESVHKLYADTMIEATQDGSMDLDDIIADISGVYFAGVHTTSATLEQSILYLVRKPEIQERIHQDLVKAFPKADFAIGSETRVRGSAGTENGISLKGLKSVLSLRAFGYEIQRLATALPLTLSRCVRKSFETEGFVIPQGSIVFSNLYAIGRDIELWGDDASDFSIDRWMMKDPETGIEKLDNSKLENLMTFGIGRRSCPGRSMADRQIQLVLAFLLRFFKIESPTGQPSDAPLLTVDQQLQNTTSFPVKVTRRTEQE